MGSKVVVVVKVVPKEGEMEMVVVLKSMVVG
jgi:hypothetical protein